MTERSTFPTSIVSAVDFSALQQQQGGSHDGLEASSLGHLPANSSKIGLELVVRCHCESILTLVSVCLFFPHYWASLLLCAREHLPSIPRAMHENVGLASDLASRLRQSLAELGRGDTEATKRLSASQHRTALSRVSDHHQIGGGVDVSVAMPDAMGHPFLLE